MKYVDVNNKQEMLHVVAIMMVNSTLSSPQKFQYFQRPILKIYSNTYDKTFLQK